MNMSANKPDAETHYSCREIAKERDTYRELCVEILEHLKRAYYTPTVKIDEPLEQSITKAEQLLGEKNGTSN